MSGAQEPHEILGVSADATPEQVTRAFRALARRYHPDGAAGDSAEFARVRAAYETLCARARVTSDDARPRRRVEERHGVSIPVRVRASAPRRGADVTTTLWLDLAQAVFGATAVVEVGRRQVLVRVPSGVRHRHRLRVAGEGHPGRHGGPPGDLLATVLVREHPVYRRVDRDLAAPLIVSYCEAVLGAAVPVTTLLGETLTVTVPPGTRPGQRLRVAGHGVPGEGRHPTGDLILEIAIDIPDHDDLGGEQHAALRRLARLLPPPGKEPRR